MAARASTCVSRSRKFVFRFLLVVPSASVAKRYIAHLGNPTVQLEVYAIVHDQRVALDELLRLEPVLRREEHHAATAWSVISIDAVARCDYHALGAQPSDPLLVRG